MKKSSFALTKTFYLVHCGKGSEKSETLVWALNSFAISLLLNYNYLYDANVTLIKLTDRGGAI